jgi:hypothetical protein
MVNLWGVDEEYVIVPLPWTYEDIDNFADGLFTSLVLSI